MNPPLAQLKIVRDGRQEEASLDGALLKQTGLLATLITERRETRSAPFVNHSELMRLVQSRRSMLSVCRDQSPLNDGGEVFAPVRKAA